MGGISLELSILSPFYLLNTKTQASLVEQISLLNRKKLVSIEVCTERPSHKDLASHFTSLKYLQLTNSRRIAK